LDARSKYRTGNCPVSVHKIPGCTMGAVLWSSWRLLRLLWHRH